VKNLSDSFFNNHPNSANREDAVEFLEKMEDLLLSDDSFDAEQIKKGIEAIRKDYKLNINLRERVEKYEEFKRDVNRLKDIGKIESEEKQDENEISSKGSALPTPAPESSTAANAKGVKIETKSSQAEHS
jgi:hypothetical protein